MTPDLFTHILGTEVGFFFAVDSYREGLRVGGCDKMIENVNEMFVGIPCFILKYMLKCLVEHPRAYSKTTTESTQPWE